MQDRSAVTVAHAGSNAAFAALLDRVGRSWPPADWGDVNVVVAVSGGSDSVALLRLLAELKRKAGGRGDLVVATFDHRLRETASREDAAWVARLAEDLKLECRVGRSTAELGDSEECLRDARRDFYRRTAEEFGARYVATGHTADDQAETVLFRALRGSGLRGLAGIRPFSPLSDGITLAHPLLEVSQAELRVALAELGQEYREDATNSNNGYTRNWLRNEVLPLVQTRFPAARSGLAALASHAAETDDLIGELAQEALRDATSRSDAWGVTLDATVLASRPPALVVEALRAAWREVDLPEQAMTAAHWRRLAEIAQSPHTVDQSDFPGGVRVVCEKGRLVITRIADPTTGGSC